MGREAHLNALFLPRQHTGCVHQGDLIQQLIWAGCSLKFGQKAIAILRQPLRKAQQLSRPVDQVIPSVNSQPDNNLSQHKPILC